jgi:hypothetical protein
VAPCQAQEHEPCADECDEDRGASEPAALTRYGLSSRHSDRDRDADQRCHPCDPRGRREPRWRSARRVELAANRRADLSGEKRDREPEHRDRCPDRRHKIPAAIPGASRAHDVRRHKVSALCCRVHLDWAPAGVAVRAASDCHDACDGRSRRALLRRAHRAFAHPVLDSLYVDCARRCDRRTACGTWPRTARRIRGPARNGAEIRPRARRR